MNHPEIVDKIICHRAKALAASNWHDMLMLYFDTVHDRHILVFCQDRRKHDQTSLTTPLFDRACWPMTVSYMFLFLGWEKTAMTTRVSLPVKEATIDCTNASLQQRRVRVYATVVELMMILNGGRTRAPCTCMHVVALLMIWTHHD